MKAGDLIRSTNAPGIIGLFVRFCKSGDYEYAEVIWFGRPSPSGGPVSSVQPDLIEIIQKL